MVACVQNPGRFFVLCSIYSLSLHISGCCLSSWLHVQSLSNPGQTLMMNRLWTHMMNQLQLISPHVCCCFCRSVGGSSWIVSCGVGGRRSAGQHANGGCCLSLSRASLLCVSPRRPEGWRLCGAHSGSPSSCLSASLRPGCPQLCLQVGDNTQPTAYILLIPHQW